MNTDSLKPRRANASDWPTVRDLLAANKLPVQGAQEHLANFLLIEQDGRLLGCIGLERYGESALLRSCAVAEEHRSRGLGKQLARSVIEHATATGVTRIALLTTTADRFFSRLGFAPVARDQLPNEIHASEEFRGACPASAIAMLWHAAPRSSNAGFHLAQVNVAYMRAPQDDPLLADFVARLDEINALAEKSPGFIWRYICDSRDPEAREYEDSMVLFNMSVWRDIDSLHAFTYRTAHAELFAKRRKWFADAMSAMHSRSMALWWIPAGQIPSADEAKQRLASLTSDGPSPYAFTFKQRFAANGERISPAVVD